MNRKQFIKIASLAGAGAGIMNLSQLYQHSRSWKAQAKQPVLFLGHGNPMNAIEENEFVEGWRVTAQNLAEPKAIICVSAHWETQGTKITAMPNPKTIHDFGGFPAALYEVEYPAPGKPDLAQAVKDLLPSANILLDHDWGLDHGAWSVIKHLYPKANIPVLQLSLDYTKGPEYHYQLAKSLASLRNKGVLLISSGNMVHNLRLTAWHRLEEQFAYDWADEAQQKMKEFLNSGDDQSLIDFKKQGKAFDLAIPSSEHYLPLLYTLGFKEPSEGLRIFNDKPIAGALSMTSLQFA